MGRDMINELVEVADHVVWRQYFYSPVHPTPRNGLFLLSINMQKPAIKKAHRTGKNVGAPAQDTEGLEGASPLLRSPAIAATANSQVAARSKICISSG
jgi:hypothetical protein